MDRLTLKMEQHPGSRRWAFFEEEQSVAFLCLTCPSEELKDAPFQDVWVYNRIPPPVSFADIQKHHGKMPPAIVGYAGPKVYIRSKPVGDAGVKFIWSEDGEAVLVAVMNGYAAFIVPGFEHGFSRGLIASGTWGQPWDEDLFRRYFRPGIPSPDSLTEDERSYLKALTDRPGTTCPVCFLANAVSKPGGWEICPRCRWEDCPVQGNDPYYWGGANSMCLFEARAAWLRGESIT